MDPNPFLRNTFWTVFIGSLFSWTASVVGLQWSVQRFISVPTKRDADMVLLVYFLGMVFVVSTSVYGGVLMYAAYYGCDPIDQKIVSRPDQMYPYFVLDKIGYIPVLPGLFVAGIFGAALSSLSSILNTLAGTIYEDYIKRKNTSDRRANLMIKIIVLFFGGLSILMVILAEKMGKSLSVTYTICSINNSPIFALFILGILVPFANATGALIGACTSIVFLTWIAIGTSMSNIHSVHVPVYPGVDTCNSQYNNITLIISNGTERAVKLEDDGIFILYKISFMYMTAIGTLLAVLVGMVVSYFTGVQDLSLLDPSLISPPLRRFLPKKMVQEYQKQQSNLMTEMIPLSSNKEYT